LALTDHGPEPEIPVYWKTCWHGQIRFSTILFKST